MDSFVKQKSLESAIAFLAGEKSVNRAYLFGSFARGDNNFQSDIDILVELDYQNGGKDFFSFLNIRDVLSDIFGTKVDLVSALGLSPEFKSAIETEKKLFYEKKIG